MNTNSVHGLELRNVSFSSDPLSRYRVTLFYMIQKNNSATRFDNLGLAKKLLEILAQNNFTTPTPIQHQCIPHALLGKDIVGIAQTGTGKTLAFGLPMIQLLTNTSNLGLILLPTRELALQVEEVLQKIGRNFGIRTTALIGGSSLYQQVQSLRRNPHIIVATPGRLLDHLNQKNVSLRNLKIAVIDEADRMFDVGFMPQIVDILKNAPTDRQTLMFSATMPPAVAGLAARYMKLPLRIEVAPAGTPATNVEQEIFITPKELKMALLDNILKNTQGTVLIFSRTKHGAKRITSNTRGLGYKSVEIHSDRTQAQRREALFGFKNGRYRIMVATDIAARGIDVENISLVVNYDLPDNSDDYIHRIGRTGRAGNIGKAVSFATPEQRRDIKQIERLIKKTIPILALPVLDYRPGTVPTKKEMLEQVTQERFPQNRSRRGPQRKKYDMFRSDNNNNNRRPPRRRFGKV